MAFGDQVILTQPLLAAASKLSHRKLWLDTLMIPAYVATLSAVVVLIHILLLTKPAKWLISRVTRREPPATPENNPINSDEVAAPIGLVYAMKKHISRMGGTTVFVYLVLQLIGSLALLSLSVASLVLAETNKAEKSLFNTLGKWGKKHKKKHHKQNHLSVHEWLQVAMCMTYLYTTLLALISLSSLRKWNKNLSRHLTIVLLSAFAVYAYRDLGPLTTYTLAPKDLSEGWIVIAKIAILALTSVFLPVLFPRQYVPVDPKAPMTPNPEQTASILSLMTYHFLDPIVWHAYHVPHLQFNELPPLADYDQSRVLTGKGFAHLDPFISKNNQRHLFWGLLRVFRTEYLTLAAMLMIQVVTSFAAPLGINRILRFLETGGEDAIVKPWFWIIWLFLGPTMGSISIQFYIYIATRTFVRAECLITQLVFEHSLRIRMKSETSEVKSASIAAPTPDTSSEENDSGDDTIRSDGSGQSETTRVASTVSTTKAKKPAFTSEASRPQNPEGTSSNLVGKINNLVTTDLNNVGEGRDFLIPLLSIPVQVALCIVFLYAILGWSAFVGLATMLILFPLPGGVARMVQTVQKNRLKKTDARVQSVSEIMNVLRMVKLFGWEKQMSDRIREKREEELKWIWIRQILDLINGHLNFCIPLVTMVTTYTTYTLVMKQPLNASKVFSSMAIFDMLRDQLHMVFYTLTETVQAKVSLDRIDEFLKTSELLDSFEEDKEDGLIISQEASECPDIGFRDAVFSWSNEVEDGTLTPSRRRFSLRVEGELMFKSHAINLIIGPTGSGKTSLLMALLGEMHFISPGPGSWFNLPRKRGVAYAAQESWVQNETIRENIIFGAAYDEDRYKKVIYQCGLERDLELFEAGDRTEVGEKGLTLSGGQKARVTLARAVYSSAEILLLDDVLAALDVHTSKWIVDKCFKGGLLKGRTVILVTHNVALASPVADFVVSLASDGTIASKGSVSDALKNNKALAEEVKRDAEETAKIEEEVDNNPTEEAKQSDGKLTVAEEIAEGHVSWTAIKLYLRGLGGRHPIIFFITFLGGMFLCQVILAYQVYFLGQWAAQYETHDPSEVSVPYYLTVYSGILAFVIVIYTIAFVTYLYGSIRASRSIHQQLVESVLGANLRWLDTTPTSRVITRCTQDVRAVDGPLSERLEWLVEMTCVMITRLFAVFLTAPLFLLAGIVVAGIGGTCGQVYMKAQLSVKREMSNAKAPVLGHFGAAIAGLTSIRAYAAQKPFKAESLNRIDRYTRAARTYYNLNRWICVRVDALGALFSASLAIYLIYIREGSTSAKTGFTLNMAVAFSSIILWWIRVLNEFEVQGNSLERIQDYIDIDHEPKPTEQGKPPAAWPTSGDIRVEGLSARYSLDGPKVLHSLSFHINSGERVGVVGRTGSGKSSLTLSLLRCIFTEGEVYYDGLPTSSMNLDSLRSSITIIPQVPELLSGTLRMNLDVFSQYDDAQLNDALRSAGLYNLQSADDEGRITLDSAIASGGSNLSVGQRQILALARAILRGSKLLILDEATSAIDYDTDAVIQNSLRNQLGNDVTLITIAHRLQTIMDADKIMVLDAGRIVEFDSPQELLKKKDGRLRSLVDESGDRDILHAMAEKA